MFRGGQILGTIHIIWKMKKTTSNGRLPQLNPRIDWDSLPQYRNGHNILLYPTLCILAWNKIASMGPNDSLTPKQGMCRQTSAIFIHFPSPHPVSCFPCSLSWNVSWKTFRGCTSPAVGGTTATWKLRSRESPRSVPRCFRNLKMLKYVTGWWFGCHILFSHILGISSSQLTNIFQRGSNHQPG